jgi:hypothetical protein
MGSKIIFNGNFYDFDDTRDIRELGNHLLEDGNIRSICAYLDQGLKLNNDKILSYKYTYRDATKEEWVIVKDLLGLHTTDELFGDKINKLLGDVETKTHMYYHIGYVNAYEVLNIITFLIDNRDYPNRVDKFISDYKC